MKSIIKSLSFVAIVAILLGTGSCKEAKDTVNEIIPLPSMKATVDGSSWVSLFRYSTLFESNNMITITGTPDVSEALNEAIILNVFGTEAGTYELALGSLSGDCAAVYMKTAAANDGEDDYYVAYQATVTISSIDKSKKQISGSFSAKLRSTGSILDEIIISNGTFENLNYRVE
jgi:hypothetical protein